MNEKFFDLKKEKQDRMINAALKVFAQNGYRHASTDDIVREAGISKGLLFHYFVSKLGLYTFIYDYSVRYMTLELTTGVKPKETDYFELLRQMEAAQIQALKNYPYMQQFLLSAMEEDVKEALLAIEAMRDSLTQTYGSIMERADMGRLVPQADPAKLNKVVRFTVNNLMKERFLEASFQPEMMFEEISGYLDMLRSLTYSSYK